MRLTAVKRVTKDEAIKYMLPALRQINMLDLPYEITDTEVIIKIPVFLPMTQEEREEMEKKEEVLNGPKSQS